MPVNSGSRPGAPLGGHSTQAGPLLEDPVGVAAPAVAALRPRVVPPLVAAPALVTPDPPVEAAPALPPVVPVVAPVAAVEVVVPVAGVEAAVPGVGVASVVDEFGKLGSATAPPPPGNPLRSVALPTAPVVGVAEGAAVCASVDETTPIDRKKANPKLRIMPGYIMRHCAAQREMADQTA